MIYMINSSEFHETEAMFTLYRIVKRSITESVPDRASVHTWNTALKAFPAPELYCSTPLLKAERSVSDRFLKRPKSSLDAFIGAKHATEPRIARTAERVQDWSDHLSRTST